MELLERLEISEIELSKLERTNRLDTEFYTKENLKVLNILEKHTLTSIFDLTKVSDGNHMAISDNFTEIGIPYYRGQDIHNYFIEQGTPICIDENSYNIPNMKRSHLQKGDVLLSIVGTIGGVSLVTTEDKATCNCKLAILRPKKVNGYYLSAFLKSKFGQNQIHKFTRGAVQKGLILEDMNQIFVPDFSIEFQSKISDLIEKARITISQSIITYSQAETILLQEIGLEKEVTGLNPVEVTNQAVEGSNPSIFTNNGANKNVNVKSFKDSFGVTGRLDAEYYQKKYENFEKSILENNNGFTYIKSEFEHIKTNSKKVESGYNYIEIGDVNVNDGSCKSNYVETIDLPANAKNLVEKGDILISNVRPYRGAITLIDFDQENLIVSGAFTVLREKRNSQFSNEVLKVLLRTSMYKEWLLKFNVGTSYPVIKDEDVLELPIPIISKQTQKIITNKIQQSQILKKQSEHLLEVAKRAVEIAIEENEEVAMAYINKNVK